MGKAVHLKNKFSAETKDVKWIEALGKEDTDWVIFSSDTHIQKVKVEKEALKNSRCPIFFFKKGFFDLSPSLQMSRIFAKLEEIHGVVQGKKKHRIYEIRSKGKIIPLS